MVEKKARLAKYGLKFQSAGNLVTVGDSVRMEKGKKAGQQYEESLGTRRGGHEAGSSSRGLEHRVDDTSVEDEGTDLERRRKERGGEERGGGERGEENKASDSKFSFGFSKKTKKEGAAPGPPPLMSRRRELMTKAFGGDSDSEGEEGEELVKMAVRGTPRFMFHIKK